MYMYMAGTSLPNNHDAYTLFAFWSDYIYGLMLELMNNLTCIIGITYYLLTYLHF